MSLVNGDKSRAHRERKQNIQRRLRAQALLQAEAARKAKSLKPTPKAAKSAPRKKASSEARQACAVSLADTEAARTRARVVTVGLPR